MMNPFFAMPPDVPISDEQRRAAMTNMLLQAGAAMVQPQQGRNSFQKFMNAIPQALLAGGQGYSQSLLGSQDAQLRQEQMEMNKLYRQSQTEHLQELGEERKYKRQEREQEQAMLQEIANMPGLAEQVAQHTKFPVDYYRKYPKALLTAIDKLGPKADEIMVHSPVLGQDVPLGQLKEFMIKSKEDKAKWIDGGYGEKWRVDETGNIIETKKIKEKPEKPSRPRYTYDELNEEIIDLDTGEVRKPKRESTAPKQGRDLSKGVAYLKGAKSREQAVKYGKILKDKYGWSYEEVKKASKEAGWD